jgi:hypothetical protein
MNGMPGQKGDVLTMNLKRLSNSVLFDAVLGDSGLPGLPGASGKNFFLIENMTVQHCFTIGQPGLNGPPGSAGDSGIFDLSINQVIELI